MSISFYMFYISLFLDKIAFVWSSDQVLQTSSVLAFLFHFSLMHVEMCNRFLKIDHYHVKKLCVARPARLVDSARILDRMVWPFPKISCQPERRYQSNSSRDGRIDRKRIRQIISRRSIAYVAEFISRSCHRSISEISSQSFFFSHFLSRPSSQCKSISFSLLSNFYFIFLSLFLKCKHV